MEKSLKDFNELCDKSFTETKKKEIKELQDHLKI
jgi:hypothetical protein